MSDFKIRHYTIIITYVNYYDREMRLEVDIKTIGIVLCHNKSDLVVAYTLPENKEQTFASKNKTVLPSEAVLRKLLKVESFTILKKQK